MRQFSIEIKRMMWIDDFKCPAGAKFCFGSYTCQMNKDGDLMPIQVETSEELKPMLDAQIRFGQPINWRSPVIKPQDITKMMEDLIINDKAESDNEDSKILSNLSPSGIPEDWVICMAGRVG